MPSLHIVRESKVKDSFRVQQLRGMFDYSQESVKHEWTVDMPLHEHKWSIGLIVGSSGAGKTTLAKEYFPDLYFHEKFTWKNNCAVIDEFSDSITTKDIVMMFNAVGFSSPPHWFKPFAHLSNGQKFRVELARCLLTQTKGVVFDEFTSVVDRDVAKIASMAIAKCLRRKERPPFVAVSCHHDVIDWLDPDWVYDVNARSFEWRLRRQLSQIRLDIYKVPTTAWRLFREYHYLNHDISPSAQCYAATWGNKPVAFTSVLHFPHPKNPKIKREHRTVVLPDFQGVGFGNKLSEWLAGHYKAKGFTFISVTSAPSMIFHRYKSKNWFCYRFGRVVKSHSELAEELFAKGSCKRITASFKYVGPAVR
jgi:ABC-type lipoprotein export system ATPase subunit/GNAT superfamily N-acetyltransferase